MRNCSDERGNVLPVVIAGVVAVLLLAGPIVLHFSQKSHNRLPFDVDQRFSEKEHFVSGEIFASTVIALIDHELESPAGWRPNDFFLWGPGLWADNNSNRQVGIIQAARESGRVLKDHLTKVSATGYDENLRNADTMLRNDERKFWFPSAENRFRAGIASLQRYLDGLRTQPPTSKPINRRNMELIRLFQAWMDLLGGAHADLYDSNVSFFRTDDFFYRAQGYAHVMYHLMKAVRREYAGELQNRPTLQELFSEVIDSLGQAAVLKPVMVLDGSPSGLIANHRHNLDVYIVDARQKMYSIREELEK